MSNSLYDILFLDIETVPLYENYSFLSKEEKELWADKTSWQRKDEYSPEEFYPRAGIWAEFGKIVCISVGFFKYQYGKRQFRVTSFFGDDEKQILADFSALLDDYYSQPYKRLCGHNAKEFDFPYICRRLIINRMPLPKILNISGKKPWEIPHYDTMDMWRFGDYKHFVSLKLLTSILNIPSPKEDIDGSEVSEVYYKDKDLKRIANYCQADTIAMTRVFLHLTAEVELKDEEIVFIDK